MKTLLLGILLLVGCVDDGTYVSPSDNIGLQKMLIRNELMQQETLNRINP